MPARPPSVLRQPAFDDAALAASGRRARRIWTAESAVERDRLLKLPPAPDRLAALDDEATRQLLTPEHRAEVRDSIDRVLDERRVRADAEAERQAKRTAYLAGLAEERRRLALMDGLRPVAVAGIAVAALLPSMVSAWRWGWSLGNALALFLASGRGLAGAALAVVAAAILGRMAGRANSLEGLAWPLLGALAAGTAGLAVAVAAI